MVGCFEHGNKPWSHKRRRISLLGERLLDAISRRTLFHGVRRNSFYTIVSRQTSYAKPGKS
jgi:hypothetical protein